MVTPDPNDGKSNRLPDDLVDALVVESLRAPSVDEAVNINLADTTLTDEDRAALDQIPTKSILREVKKTERE